jgi:hypothetical protein
VFKEDFLLFGQWLCCGRHQCRDFTIWQSLTKE